MLEKCYITEIKFSVFFLLTVYSLYLKMNNSISVRMKRYEAVSKNILMQRTPVIIRLDGKAFHTFTKRFDKPFDDVFMKAMQKTLLQLCQSIPGCVFGYTQSDEISLILVDYFKINVSPWFDNEVQKLCSVTSSMATLYFNKLFESEVHKFLTKYSVPDDTDPNTINFDSEKDRDLYYTYVNSIKNGGLFDSRCFNVPENDVCNYFIWRQQDATRNSIQMTAQAYYSHKQLQGLTCNDIQEKLFTEKGINWDNFSTYKKRGCSCIKKFKEIKNQLNPDIMEKETSYWEIDNNIPIFSRDRNYIESLIIKTN